MLYMQKVNVNVDVNVDYQFIKERERERGCYTHALTLQVSGRPEAKTPNVAS